MDVAPLEAAQQRFVAAIDNGVGRFAKPADSSWPAELVVAHMTLTTELLVRTTEQVLTGVPTWWDNAPTTMRAGLLDVARSAGDICALLDRYWFAAEALTHVAAKLSAAQAATPVVVRVVSGAVAVIDQVPMPWTRALRWHYEQHLPEHAAELSRLVGRS
jgi:hypothetical protein